MRMIAIDPGNRESAMVVIDAETLKPLDKQLLPNEELRRYIKEMQFDECDRGAIEMMQSFGNLIGRDVLETSVWIGRYFEVLKAKLFVEPTLIFRKEETLHICHGVRAGDTEIKRALIDRFCTYDFRTGKGTKKNPDFFYGFKDDIWSAYAVGLTCLETKMEE